MPAIDDSHRVKRIGHKGADLIAPGNTVASFQAALAAGVEMIEFDVLPEHPDGSGRLVLAHDFVDAGSREPLTLEEGLEHFASDAYADVELDVDLKLAGYEREVIAGLRRHGLVERTLVSTMEQPTLLTVRELAPELRLGWSVPRVRRNYLAHPATRIPALAALQVGRRVLPGRAARELRAGRIDAIMSHWGLVTPQLVDAVLGAGGELYVWTVDDRRRIDAFERLGVTGVITNDPRLFAPATQPG
jgi:glycerophosphoryl diester phosphodiesterase